MSVRATERLIGDVVIATGLPNSPLMIVQSIEEETKTINTTWFSDSHECQEGSFPASSLDRAEPPKTAAKKPAASFKAKPSKKPVANNTKSPKKK
jgi:hypothetical protein